jgi:pimeloyl-ACP methyl ester carboxylesterase
MNATRPISPATIRFLAGGDDDYPILMPLIKPGTNASSSIAFCRMIHPTASVLVPDLRQYALSSFRNGRNSDDIVLDGLSRLLDEWVPALNLALFPIVAVGHGAGADLATKFALRKTSYLAAAILFAPSAQITVAPTGSLGGLSVLLVTTALAASIGSSEWKIRTAFSAGGAQVVCEYVAPRSRNTSRDAALARVFIASQFGLSD